MVNETFNKEWVICKACFFGNRVIETVTLLFFGKDRLRQGASNDFVLKFCIVHCDVKVISVNTHFGTKQRNAEFSENHDNGEKFLSPIVFLCWASLSIAWPVNYRLVSLDNECTHVMVISINMWKGLLWKG